MNLVILWYVWTVILICTKTLEGSQKKAEDNGEPSTDIAILSRKQMVDTLKISAGSERQISKLQIFDFINAVDNIIEELNALGGESPTFKADKYSPIVNDVRQGSNVVIPTLARVGGIPLRLIKILCNFNPAPHGTALYRTYDSVVILPSSRYCTIRGEKETNWKKCEDYWSNELAVKHVGKLPYGTFTFHHTLSSGRKNKIPFLKRGYNVEQVVCTDHIDTVVALADPKNRIDYIPMFNKLLVEVKQIKKHFLSTLGDIKVYKQKRV